MAYSGKVAIVTGIGLGITEHLLREGANVVVADLNAVQGAKVVEKLNNCGESLMKRLNSSSKGRAEFCATDVTSWASVCELFAFSYVKFGRRIDYVFANAGIAQMQEMRSSNPTYFATAKQDDLETLQDRPPSLAVIRVNLDGVLYTLHAALAYFRKQEKDKDGWRGKFVGTGSNACQKAHFGTTSDRSSFYPFPNDPLYAAAKSGVLGICRAVGPKVFEEGITVNCFGPSVVATGLAPPEFLAMLEREGRLTPMKTITDAADVFINPKSKVTGACDPRLLEATTTARSRYAELTWASIAGQIIENCGTRNAFRAIPGYMDDNARKNMNEFHSSDQIDQALSVEGAGLDVVA
ncbi:SPOSA6832_02467, partial [Sporobolomyces salmonicolor]